MGIGLNYADHFKESGQETPRHQVWFTKAITAINGPFDPIEIPRASPMVDYEAELVVVVGKRCRHVPKESAAEVTFGYCAGNDVSVRDWQLRAPQWVLGKSFDTHAPIGPWIVTADELGNPHTMASAASSTASGGKTLTPKMWCSTSTTRSRISAGPDLHRHSGRRWRTMRPPKFLKAGDKVRVEIDRIGTIEAVMRPEGE